VATARYEVLIPKVDNLGSPLRDLASPALAYITQALQVTTAHIELGRSVYWGGRTEPFDALVFTAEDNPQADSSAKQLGAYIGDVANQDVILVSKDGKAGLQSWPIKNNQYRPGETAEPTALA
jgi:hypothetical protein